MLFRGRELREAEEARFISAVATAVHPPLFTAWAKRRRDAAPQSVAAYRAAKARLRATIPQAFSPGRSA